MEWLLLNQHYAVLDSNALKVVVLEEVLSSELQLVSVLVSGGVSMKTMQCLLYRLTPETSIRNLSLECL